MTLAWFDCASGIAGDMAVAALVDLGFPVEEIAARVKAMGLPIAVGVERVTRGGLAAARYRVEAGHDHEHRGLAECNALVRKAALAPKAEAIALDAFRRLATAEARLHATTPDKVHFHEVGAADALADIVGFATAYHGLGLAAGEAVASPLPFTRGRVDAQHGSLPVPAPATLALLEGFEMEASPVEGELVTPTGAALLASVATPGASLGRFALSKTGHGAGTREIPGRPNLLRVSLVEPRDAGTASAWLLETNLDDTTPQLVAALCDSIREAGALDVWTTAIQMKKGRPGWVVSVLATDATKAASAKLLFRESTTLGVRISRVERETLEREIVRVETHYGPIAMKIGRRNGEILNAAPEFEDVKAAAEKHGVPLKVVISAALAAWRPS
jgi:uncharacterized protein (TIGR00299 family) protein